MHTFAGSVHSRRRGGLSALLAAPVCLPLCVAGGVGVAVNCAPTVDTFLKVSTILLCSTTPLYHTVPPRLPHALSRYIYPTRVYPGSHPPRRGGRPVVLLPSCCRRPVHVLPACRRCPYSIYTTGGALARAYSCGGSPGVSPVGGSSPSLCAFSIIAVITYLFTDRPAFFAHFCRFSFVTLPPFFHCRVSLSNVAERYFFAAFSCASLVLFMDFYPLVYAVMQ